MHLWVRTSLLTLTIYHTKKRYFICRNKKVKSANYIPNAAKGFTTADEDNSTKAY